MILYKRTDSRDKVSGKVGADPVNLTDTEIARAAKNFVMVMNSDLVWYWGFELSDIRTCSHVWTHTHLRPDGFSAGVEEVVHLRVRGAWCRIEMASWNCGPSLEPGSSWWGWCKRVLGKGLLQR